MTNNHPQLFKREWYLRAIFDSFLLYMGPFCVWLIIHTFFFYAKPDVIEARVISLALACFFPILFVARLAFGNIRVDDDCIGWWAWGKRWLYIRWQNVKVITVEIAAAYNQITNTQTMYNLYPTDKIRSLFYLRKFDDHIPNAPALIDAVDHYVRQYQIPVLDRRGDGSTKTKRYFLWLPVSKTEVRRNTIK
jgi:hypothetical protein